MIAVLKYDCETYLKIELHISLCLMVVSTDLMILGSLLYPHLMQVTTTAIITRTMTSATPAKNRLGVKLSGLVVSVLL